MYRKQVLGAFGVQLYFLAKAGNRHIYGSRYRHRIISPHFIEQLITGDDNRCVVEGSDYRNSKATT
jgi:hypothetical protein